MVFAGIADLLHFLRAVAAVGGTGLASRQDRSACRNKSSGNWAIAAFALGLGVVTFVVRIWALFGVYYEPWHLEWAHAPQYIALFIVGTVAYRGNWLVRFTEAQVRPWRWIALIFILLMPARWRVAAGALSGQLTRAARAA